MYHNFRIIPLLLFLLLYACSKPADSDREFEEGSNIKLAKLDSTSVKRLAVIGKAWGLLKYHHPYIAEGNINWDNALLRVLPNAADPQQDFQQVFDNLIQPLGDIREYGQKAPLEEEGLVPPYISHNWIRKSGLLTNKQQAYLEVTTKASGPFLGHYYIESNHATATVSFTNERSYEHMEYTDDGIKLISLFRYWSAMNYFSPNKQLTDRDWDDILPAYIQNFADADDRASYIEALAQLTTEMNDAHVGLSRIAKSSLFGENLASVRLKILDDSTVVVAGFFEDSVDFQLFVGDTVVSIEGQTVDSRIRKFKSFISHGNSATLYRDLERTLIRTDQDSLTLTVRREAVLLTVKENAKPYGSVDIFKQHKPGHTILEGNIGYLSPRHIPKDELGNAMDAIMDTRGLIIDLRSYPKLFRVYDFARYFCAESKEVAYFTKPLIDHPGYFKKKEVQLTGDPNSERYEGAVIVLVSETTQSKGEYYAMGIQACKNVRVMGRQTAGANGSIAYVVLPGNIRTSFSGLGVLYPDGFNMQRVGVRIDLSFDSVYLHPSSYDQDPMLLEAKKILMSK